MNEKQALQIFYQLIEQATAQGFFKQLKQLDTARTSYETLKTFVEKTTSNNPNNEKQN